MSDDQPEQQSSQKTRLSASLARTINRLLQRSRYGLIYTPTGWSITKSRKAPAKSLSNTFADSTPNWDLRVAQPLHFADFQLRQLIENVPDTAHSGNVALVSNAHANDSVCISNDLSQEEAEQQFCIFVLRDWCRLTGILPWVTDNLRHFGFDVKLVQVLDKAQQQAVEQLFQHGSGHPLQKSGVGPPYAIVAVCDYVPSVLDEDMTASQPRARNVRAARAEQHLNRHINNALPMNAQIDPIKIGFEQADAWDYLAGAFPHLVDQIQARVIGGYEGLPATKLKLSQGNRAVNYLIFRDGNPCVLKAFSDSEEGQMAYKAELEASQQFGHFPWAPNWIASGPNWILMQFFPQACRLDRIASGLDEHERLRLAAELVHMLHDIWSAGYAHRDFHAENVFLVGNALKLIDFETLAKRPEGGDFASSYDVVGKGLPSPFRTGGMCYSKRQRAKAICNVLGVDFQTAAAHAFKSTRSESATRPEVS